MSGVAVDDRFVPFEACFNFRDLGGYEAADGRSVVWGRLYRSDSLHRLTAADAVPFQALGLATVIDLRSDKEIEDFGRFDGLVPGPDWHHRPIIERVSLQPGARLLPEGEEQETLDPGEGYFRFLGSGEAAISVLALISEADGPVVFHCTSGKDRAGMIAALVLDLLGVPDETIVEDYLLSQQTRAQALAWIAENEPRFAAYLARIPPERQTLHGDTIMGFLERVRATYGSVVEFVLARGLTEAQLARLREGLLVDAD